MDEREIFETIKRTVLFVLPEIDPDQRPTVAGRIESACAGFVGGPDDRSEAIAVASKER